MSVPPQWQTDPRGTGADDGPSLLTLINVLLRHVRIVIALPVLFMGVAAAAALSTDRSYVASARVLPEVESAPTSGLSGLASQLGVNVGSRGPGESMEFYAELLKSRELLRETVSTEYPVGDGGTGIALTEIFETEAVTPEGRIRSAVARLREGVTVNMLPRAGIIELKTSLPDPVLAEAVNRRMLELLNEFNLQKRQSRTSAERAFIEARVEEARSDLRDAEERFESFLQRNRRYEASPELQFEAGRLQREMEIRQQVYVSLAQAYEQARIEEVRNTPVVTVFEPPEGSARPESRRTLWWAVTGFAVGLVLAIGLAATLEVFDSHRRRRPEELAEFHALKGELLAGLLPGRRREPSRSTARAADQVSTPTALR